MSRFGDFTLLEDLGRSALADRYKATHATLGGPFFLKVYRRLDVGHHGELVARGDRLIGQSHPNLAPHLGHGVVEGVPFTVSPWLDGIDLVELAASLKDRRVNLTLDHCLLIVGDLGNAVAALHAIAPRLAHGDVSLTHVRVGPEGQVWLTGLCTPRGLAPGKVPEARFDLAGVGALIYDLVPLLRGGAARPPLPTILDRVVRRALGIGPATEHLTPAEFTGRLGEVFASLKLNPDRAPLSDLIRRTIRAVEKKAIEQGRAGRTAADAIPELAPVDLAPSNRAPSSSFAPSPVSSLSPSMSPSMSPPMSPSPTASGGYRPAPALEPLPERTRPMAPLPVSTPSTPPSSPLAPIPQAPSSSSSSLNVPPLQPMQPMQPPPGSFLTGSAARAQTIPTAVPVYGVGTPIEQIQRPPPPPTLAPNVPPLPPPGAVPPRPPGVPSSSTPAPFLTSAPPPPSPFASPFASPFVQPSGSFSPATTSPFGPPGPPSLTNSASPFSDPFNVPRPAQAVAPRPATMAALPTQPAQPPTPPGMADLPSLAPMPVTSSMLTPISATGPGISSGYSAHQSGSPRAAVNAALHERTDPDATRPLRIAAQKALPAVQVLLAAGVVRPDQVEAAASEQASRGGRTLEILVAHGAATDAGVADALARATGRPRLRDDDVVVKDRALLKRLPQTYALARRLLPLALDGGTLILAVADPFEQKVIDEVRDLVHAIGVDVRIAARAALTTGTLRAFSDASGSAVGSGPRVLLGIQDDDQASKLGARLAQEGMQVEHVVDGATARQILTSRPPDALICTWNLPKVDGQALLLASRANERTLEMPVFVIGPRGDDDLMAKVLDLGADDYFNDPIRPDVVVAKLRRAVGKAAGRPSQPPVVVEQAPPPKPATPPPLPPKKPVAAAPPPMLGGLGGDDFAFDDLPDLPPEFDTGGPEVPSMPTGVMGTLRQMALPEIVQSLEMGRKTASVDIVPAEGEKGSIAFEQGAIRFAECGGEIGEQAFFALMRHKDGFFRIHYGDAPRSINIEAPTTFLLLEAMRLMDEEGL